MEDDNRRLVSLQKESEIRESKKDNKYGKKKSDIELLNVSRNAIRK